MKYGNEAWARDLTPWDLACLSLFAVASFLLVANNLSIDNAVVFHDEYLYKVWADGTLDHVRLIQNGIVPPIPNRLYTWVFGPAAHAGLNAYDVAQWLNVGFWGLGCVAVWTLARRAGVYGSRLAIMCLAVVAVPLSSYTKYFMPEAMYTCVFLTATCVLMEAVRRDAWRWYVAAGALVAALYYVKPHGVMILGIYVLFALARPGRRHSIGALLGGFLAVFLLLRRLLPTLVTHSESSLGVYEGMLRSLGDRLGHYPDGWGGLVAAFGHVALPHVAMFAALYGAPLVFTIGLLFRGTRLMQPVDVPALPPRRAFAGLLIVSSVVLMAVAILFTVLAGEIGRIHTRYYSFLFPLWLAQVAMLAEYRPTLRGSIIASLATLGGAAWLWFAASAYSPIVAISHVSDGPEWGWLYAQNAFPIALILLVLASLRASWFRHGGRLLLASLAFVGVVATVETAISQKTTFRNGSTDGRDAVAVEQIIGTDAIRDTVVVGRDLGEVDKFLFFLRGVPYVDLRPEGSAVDDVAAHFPGARWLVTITTQYTASHALHCRTVGHVRLCSLQATGDFEASAPN